MRLGVVQMAAYTYEVLLLCLFCPCNFFFLCVCVDIHVASLLLFRSPFSPIAHWILGVLSKCTVKALSILKCAQQESNRDWERGNWVVSKTSVSFTELF